MSYREKAKESYGAELDVPFPIREYSERLDRTKELMAEAGIDMLYCTSPESMFYLTGFRSEWYQAQSPKDWAPVSGVAIHRDADEYVHLDMEMEEQLLRYTSISEDVRIWEPGSGTDRFDFIIDNLDEADFLGGTVGLELRNYRPNPYHSRKLQEAFEAEGCEIVDGTDVVRDARREKSELELSYVRKAGRIADIGMQAAIEFIEPGVTELEIKAELERAMARAGGEVSGIPTHVATGSRVASFHSLASRTKVMPGDLVSIDLCGVYNRYHANLSRMISVGEPDEAVAEQIQLAADAMGLLEDSVELGGDMQEVNDTLEEYYRDVGIWDDRWFAGGYELGIAFPPDWVNEFLWGPEFGNEGDTFTPDMAVNYESDFYLPRGAGMCGLIETIVVDSDGAEILSDLSPDLFVV